MLDELRFKVTVVEGKQAEASKQTPVPRRDSKSILIKLKVRHKGYRTITYNVIYVRICTCQLIHNLALGLFRN